MGEILTDSHLIGGQRADPNVISNLAGGRRTAVHLALTVGAELLQIALEQRCGRMIAAQIEAAQLDLLQPLEQTFDQIREWAPAARTFQEVVAAGRLPGQTDARLPPGVGQEPGVQFSLHLGQLLSRFQSVRGDDQELAGGVDDLAGPWQIQRLQHAQRRAFAQQ